MKEYFITNPEDKRVADFIGLSNHKLRQLREKDGGDMAPYFIGEGIIVINRALTVEHKLLTLIISEKFDHSQITTTPKGCNIFRCSPSVLEAITGRPNLKDPIGTFLRPPQSTFEELTRKANLIVMRNAAAFGVDAVLFDPQSCDPFYRRAVRVSMGQVFSVPHTQVPSVPEAIDALKEKGFLTIALTPDPKSQDLGVVLNETSRPIVLIIGSEGFGLSTNSLTAADCTAKIPMHNNVDSLNVATSLAIALYTVQN